MVPIFNQPDCAMPLFEYVKLAAALAENQAGKFRLVVGDLSGIQDFIYTISSENALKILRARSFYLELMIKTVAYEICAAQKLTSANIFYAGGGNFLLLLPEENGLDDVLNKYYQVINRHFLNHFQGNLHLAFASVLITEEELKSTPSAESDPATENSIQKKWNTLFERELTNAKNKRFHSIFNPAEGNPELENLGIPADVPEKSCLSCHIDVSKNELDNENYCQFCAFLKKIGQDLHHRFEIEVQKFNTTDFSSGIAKTDRKWPFATENPNNPRFRLNEIITDSVPTLFYCNYVLDKKDDKGIRTTAEFKDMAEKAIGAKRIATMAMDVDNMSAVFQRGILVNDPREFLVYAPTLSRNLDYFFKIGLTRICEKPEYRVLGKNHPYEKRIRQLSVIYAGGDDLLIVGAWDDVSELAIDLQSNFKKFVCENTDMGISGGIYLSNHSFPFYVSVNKAKDAENQYAKKNYLTVTDAHKAIFENNPLFSAKKCQLKKKNSIVFFYDELTSFFSRHKEQGFVDEASGQNSKSPNEARCPDSSQDTIRARYLLAARWSEVEQFIKPALAEFLDASLCSCVNEKVVTEYPRSFIGKLYEMHQKYLTFPEGQIYLPDLVYHYSRMDKHLRNKLKNIYARYAKYQKKQPENPIRYLPVVLNWLELLIREKGE